MSIADLLGCDNIQNLMKKIVVAQSLTTFGRSGNYVCRVNDIEFFVKIALYPLLPHNQWKVPPESERIVVDAEIDIMRAIKTRIIDTGISPHFIEILAVAKCEDVAKYVQDKDRCEQQLVGTIPGDAYPSSLFCTFMDMIASGDSIDKFALIFSEKCKINLHDFLSWHIPIFPPLHDSVIISILFQIYYTLASTRRIWKNFRHGDLLPHNIMIKIMSFDNNRAIEQKQHYLQYKMDRSTWNVPFFGFFIKIIDFGHGEIPEEGIISSLKRANDLWVPDHILFIIHIEALLQELNLITPNIRIVLNILNSSHLSIYTSYVKLVKLASRVIDPEDALNKFHVFSQFETKVDKDLIIHKYNAPEKRDH